MAHLPDLIRDLALILAAAAIITLLFKKLKQPLVLGYIIAGFLVGPYFKWLPTIREVDNIRIWAEIGVIFLLFSLGLEFSFKKLLRVGGSASITAVIEVIVMVAIGYGVGRILDWSAMDSLFLGGILSISSTTIIIRAFDELGLKTKHFASLVFGVLIIEDLVAIVLMVLLSTVAVSRQFEGVAMILSILKLVFFIVIWFLLGIFFIPTFLKKIKQLVSNEMLLIISIALCMVMVLFADTVGFSPALGAFVMGSILAETTKAEKIEHILTPVKDLFGAIFFVSVGMLIDPAILAEYAWPIAILCVATILGKILSTSLGALISGQTLQNSLQAGFSLAQIGEFSFIIATLGLTLKVTSDFLYPIAVAVSAVTTLTTPYLISSSASFTQWLVSVLPKGFTKRIERYSSDAKKASKTVQWKQFVRATALNILLFSILIVAIIVLSSVYVLPWVMSNGNAFGLQVLAAFLTLVVLSPFLWALSLRTPGGVYSKMRASNHYKGLIFLTRVIRLSLTALYVGMLLHLFFNLYAGIAFSALTIILLLLFSEKIQTFYSRLEVRFVRNLNQREIEQDKTNRTELAPWNAHIAPIVVPGDSVIVGKKLIDLKLRESTGVNIVMIKRGDIHIPAPDKDQMIFPHDELLILGTDIQIQKLKVIIRPAATEHSEESDDVELYEYIIPPESMLIGENIRNSGIRQQANGLVVGLERNNERILNPESDLILQPDDRLFIVGNRKKLIRMLKSAERAREVSA